MRTRVAVLRFVLGIAILGVAVAVPCRAQNVNVTDQTMPQIPNAGHNLLGNLNESVNPANGSVGLRIAMPVPPGRKLTLPFSIAFSGPNEPCYQPQGPGGVTGCPQLTPFSASGWSYVVPQATRSTVDFNPGTRYADMSTNCDATTNYIFTDPSGAQHTMQMANIYNNWASLGQPPTQSQACNMSGYIQALNYAPTALNGSAGGEAIYSGALIGADVWGLYSNTDVNSEGSPTFADADGTVYSFAATSWVGTKWCGEGANEPHGIWGYPQSVTDRNGNSVNISYTCQNATNTWAAADSLGRPALSATWVNSPANGSTDSVSVAGIANPYTLHWGSISWTGGYTMSSAPITSMEPYPNLCIEVPYPNNGVVHAGNGTAVTSITLPNGQSYQLSYDPGSGLLSQIKYPSGGTITYTWGVNSLSSMVQFSSAQGTECAYKFDTNAVTKRVVSFDGVSNALEQDFSYTTNWDPSLPGTIDSRVTEVTTKDLVRGTSFLTVYTYGASGIEGGPDISEQGNEPHDNPWPFLTFVPVEKEIQYYADVNKTVLLKTVDKGW